MQFTVERETDGKLPSLDTCVQRTTDRNLETVFYRKPTHTDKCLSFNSHHPRSHEKSVVTTLFQSAENLTSSNDGWKNERQYVTNVLKKNDYRKSFLHDCLRRLALPDCSSPEGDSAVKSFAIVPYIQGIAEPIRRVLNNCCIKVALKPFRTLGHIFAKHKDRVPTDRKTHAVYSTPCGGCEKVYIWVKQNVSFAHVSKNIKGLFLTLTAQNQFWLNTCVKQAIYNIGCDDSRIINTNNR